jgi:hypothetical protein
MPLDAQTQAVVDSIAASGEPPMHKLSVAEARQAQLKAVAAMGGKPETVGCDSRSHHQRRCHAHRCWR